MNPDHLTSLLAKGAVDGVAPSTACPDEGRIAGYVDGEFEKAARARLELHLADCTRCLELVGLLCRLRHADVAEAVPGEVVARARALVTKEPERRWRLAPQWAAAAALVLAVPLLLQLGRGLDHDAKPQGRPDAPARRAVASAAAGLQVLSPGAGTAVDVRQLSFRWTEVSGTPYYDVRIVTDAGDVIIQQRVTGTTWWPPAPLGLQPGADYFVHIDAYPSGDKAVSSGHVLFRVSD